MRSYDEIIQRALSKANEHLLFEKERVINWEIEENYEKQWGSSVLEIWDAVYPKDDYPEFYLENGDLSDEGDGRFQSLAHECTIKEQQEFADDYPDPTVETIEDLDNCSDHMAKFYALKSVMKDLGKSTDINWAQSGSVYMTVYLPVEDEEDSSEEIRIRFADHESSPMNEASKWDISPTMHTFTQVLNQFLKKDEL